LTAQGQVKVKVKVKNQGRRMHLATGQWLKLDQSTVG